MWQLTSIRSQIVGYANRSCYCSIAVFMGPTVPKPPSPLPLCFSPPLFLLRFSQSNQALSFSLSFKRKRASQCEITVEDEIWWDLV